MRKQKNVIAIAATAVLVCLLLIYGGYRALSHPSQTGGVISSHGNVIICTSTSRLTTFQKIRQSMLRNNAHLTTDKPIYRGGDTLHWSAVIVDAFHGPPPACDDVREAQITLNSPKGDTVFTQLYSVSSAMLRRTTDWILSRQNQNHKRFQRNTKTIGHFGAASQDITDAYIIWSLTYAGIEIPDSHISYLVNLATSTSIRSSSDSYFIGLPAGILYRVGDKTEGHKLAQKLISNQQKDGSVIAILAWLNDAEFALQVELAIHFLTSRCADGKFGSTQGTVLALKAIIAYDKYRTRNMRKPGAVRVVVDGEQIGAAVKLGISADNSSDSSSSSSTLMDVILLPDISTALTEGEHTIRLEVLVWLPQSLASHRFRTTSCSITELVRANKMSFYEINGRYIILYWRDMDADQHIYLPIDVEAVLPGEYTGQASHVYEYYHDEQKVFVEPLHVRITPILQ